MDHSITAYYQTLTHCIQDTWEDYLDYHGDLARCMAVTHLIDCLKAERDRVQDTF